MKVRELIEELEQFAETFGNLEVAVNRNGRDYPVFIKASGAFPAHTNQLRENSGYFTYEDTPEEIDLSNEEVPCPECGTTMNYEFEWADERLICPNCNTVIDGKAVREDFFGININLCVVND